MDLSLIDRALAGRPLRLWWRDDDAGELTPALERLIDLAARLALPLAVAAVPDRLHAPARARLRAASHVTLLVHGLAHTNHAPPGAKKAEFGPHRPLGTMRAELALALRMLPEAAPVFVPPWNRIDPDLVPLLPELGFRGLSTHGAKTFLAPGLVQANTWIDPIDWRGTRGFHDPQTITAQLLAAAQHSGPVGLLTHHAAMDAQMWDSLTDLLTRLSQYHPVLWSTVDDLFTIPA